MRHEAVYVDLADPARGEFRATGDVVATAESIYVSKHDTPYELWNRLIESHARVQRDSETRQFEQGDNELRGGQERSERRGAGAVGSAVGRARH